MCVCYTFVYIIYCCVVKIYLMVRMNAANYICSN